MLTHFLCPCCSKGWPEVELTNPTERCRACSAGKHELWCKQKGG